MKKSVEMKDIFDLSIVDKNNVLVNLMNDVRKEKERLKNKFDSVPDESDESLLLKQRLTVFSLNEEMIQEQLDISKKYLNEVNKDLASLVNDDGLVPSIDNISPTDKKIPKTKIKNKPVIPATVDVVDSSFVPNPIEDNENNQKNEVVAKILEDLGIKERESLQSEYQARLASNDYVTAFKLLTARINSLPDKEDYQELEDFFQDYKLILRKAAEKDIIHKFAICFSDFLADVKLSDKNKELLVYLFPIGAMSLCFSALVSAGALNKASVLKPYINNNLNAYPNVLKDLISQNKIEALDFLLENTTNRNFNNNEIMNLLLGLSSYEKIYYFFNKYGLNINTRLSEAHHNPTILAPEWNTLFARIIESRNYELFEKILNDGKQRPEMSVFVSRGEKVKHYSVFYLLGNDPELIRFVSKALDYKDISNNEINGILALLMQNPQVLLNSINAGVVDKLFEHPNLKNVSFIDGTVHLFGFLSCADYWCKVNLNDVVIESLSYVLNKFITFFPDINNLPVGKSVNIYGSTVFFLESNREPRLLELLYPVLYHYRGWINVENPCGKTPIEFVHNDNKILLETLLKLGAVKRKKSLFSHLTFWKKDEILSKIDFSARSILNQENESTANELNYDSKSSTNNVENVEQELKDSFNRVRPKLKKTPLDIRLACEDLFLNAEGLLLVTEEKEKGKFNEDIFFLIQTFNDYLPSILDTYLASVDLDFNTNGEHANKEDRVEVLKQIGMLDAHIKKLKSNIEMKMKKNLNLDIRKNTEFLKERLGVNDESARINDIDTQILKNSESNKGN